VSDTTSGARVVRGGLVVAFAMAVLNVASYAFTVIAARVLGPADYGAFAAMMGLVIVANVVSLGLQATAARRVAADPTHRDRAEAEITVTARRAALLLAGVCLLAVPLVTWALHLDTWLTAATLAVPAAAYAVMGGQVGVLQGEQRWWALAAVFCSYGVARLAFGMAGILAWPHPLGAMTGVAVGALVPAVIGWAALRRRGTLVVPGPAGASGAGAPGSVGVLRETAQSSHALFAFFALSSIDVLAARAVLDAHEAGLYAAGVILSKAVLFLPYFVIVVAFPAMSRRGGNRHLHLWGLAGVLGIGAVVLGVVAVLPALALVFVGGSEYAALQGELWAFAGLGAVLAGVQLLVYSAIARRHAGAVWYLWAALVAITAGLPVVSTTTELLTLVIVVDATLLVVLTLVTRRDVVERVDL
jgi:O-antigen/teichoic acid export membrane protein